MNMFEWDRSKAKQNEAKHGVSFAETFGVFEDPNALTLDQNIGGEGRFVTYRPGRLRKPTRGGVHVAR